MPCYSPLRGYRSRRVNPKTGKRPVVFNVQDGFPDLVVDFACGQCVGCRLERSRQWAVRCVHEASLHEENCFLTLTYNDEHLPEDGSLRLEHFQNFMKRFRMLVVPPIPKEIKSDSKLVQQFMAENGVRFFHCGEYGEKYGRPHYHAIIFGWDFPDKEFYKTDNGNRLYTSGMLDALWSDDNGEPLGFALIGAVTFESAAYVARYVLKKITGEQAEHFYGGLKPEYTTMSRRPGIASGWLEKFRSDVYPCDNVVVRGKVLTPPKFYDRKYEIEFPEDMAKLKAKRKFKALSNSADNTPERLEVKKAVKLSQLNFLKRGYENG